MSARRRKTEQEVMDAESPSPELVATRDQLRALEAENDSLKSQVGSDAGLFEYVKKSIMALKPYPSEPIPVPKLHHADHDAVLVITDAHSDECVIEDEMEGGPAYNWNVFQTRIDTVAEKTIELTNIVRQASHVQRLHVWMLGDLFLGQIHPEEGAWGASMPLPVALPAASRVMADAIMRMAAHFDTVRVTGMVGNHGRDTKKPCFKMTADRNWDMTCYLIMQEFCRHAENVEWCLPKSIMHVEPVMGWRNLLTHGNCVNVTHRTPYFGIEDTFLKQHDLRRGTDTDFDYAWMGHFHHEACLRGTIQLCPSLIGANQFSRYKMHSATKASQLLQMFTEKHGKTLMFSINLG